MCVRIRRCGTRTSVCRVGVRECGCGCAGGSLGLPWSGGAACGLVGRFGWWIGSMVGMQLDTPAGSDAGRGLGAVTVYCSSSEAIDPSYASHARTLGEALASRGIELVYGGGSRGLMGELARSCREAGGRVVGVITERLREQERVDMANAEVHVVGTMRERKRMMEERGDGFVVLPGGLGTLEEFFEILVGRHLGDHGKPIGLLNCNDPADRTAFYAPLLGMFEHMEHNRFMSPSVLRHVDVCRTTEELCGAIDGWRGVGAGSEGVG